MRIAITGGIAEGKSTVRAMIADRGFRTASADDVARLIFRREEINARLAHLIGVEPPITGAELGSAIANEAALRRRVNGVMHPAIASEMRTASEGLSGPTFDEIPLLIETCRFGDYDLVWTVVCAPAEKARRMAERYGEALPTFAPIARAQVSGAVRACFSDAVIKTDGTFEDVERQVDACLAEACILPGPAA